MLDLAKKYNAAGDPISSVSVLAVLFKKRDQTPLTMSTAVQRSVEYTVDILTRPSLVISRDQVAIVYDALGEVLKRTDNRFLRKRALDAIEKMTQKALALNAVPELAAIDNIIFIALSTYRVKVHAFGNNIRNVNETDDYEEETTPASAPGEDLEVYATVRNTVKQLLQAAATQVPLVSSKEFGKAPNPRSTNSFEVPEAYTVMFHDYELHDINMQAYFNDSESVEAVVAFGDELRKRFSPPWSCDDVGGERCHSVVYSITLYPRVGPFPEKKFGHRLTPILDVNIFSPTSGKEQRVEGYLNAIQMSLTISGNEPAVVTGRKYQTKCYFWSETKQRWMTDGVHSSGTANGKLAAAFAILIQA